MKYTTIDQYIALQPEDKIERLEKLRSIIRSVVPRAEETISYMIPTFEHKGKLVGFGVFKDGCSFYPYSSSILSKYKEEIKEYKHSKGTLQIRQDQKIPVTLIKAIVKDRKKENEEKEALKIIKKNKS